MLLRLLALSDVLNAKFTDLRLLLHVFSHHADVLLVLVPAHTASLRFFTTTSPNIQMDETIQFSTETIEKLKARAENSRKFARLLVLMNVLIVIGMLVIFFSSTSQIYNTNLAKRIEISGLGFSYRNDQAIEIPDEGKANSSTLDLEERKLLEENKRLSQQISERAFIITSIGEMILRFGSVFLAIYLISILVNITRYHFRMSDHLFSVVSALELCPRVSDDLSVLSELISPKHIDFGSPPKSLNDNLVTAVRDAISKLPGKAD